MKKDEKKKKENDLELWLLASISIQEHGGVNENILL